MKRTPGAKRATGDTATAIVTLTTDFGEGSPYVAALKGVLLSHVPNAAVVDVTHTVPAFDVWAGAFLLWAGTREFPPGSVHLAVVDPGVGSARRRLALRTERGNFYVAPDNGLLELVIQAEGIAEAVELPRPPGASATFEGRDVFAPAAGRLAAGRELAALGGPLQGLPAELAQAGARVLWVDNFGNLVTSLKPPLRGVRLGRHEIAAGAPTFALAPHDGPFFYEGSLGFIEIGIREGSAAEALGAGPGTQVLPIN